MWNMQDVREQLEELIAEAELLAGPLTEAQLNWRPAAGRWSVGECLQHLSVATRKFHGCIEKGVAEARREGWKYTGPARMGLMGRVVLWVMEPPVVFAKAKAPAEMVPGGRRKDVLEEFRAAHRAVIAAVPEWMEWDVNRTLVESPLVVKYPVGVVLRVIAAHGRRHLWQAGVVRAMEGFPEGAKGASGG